MNPRTVYDPYPNYNSAGTKTKFGQESAQECFNMQREGPGTPEHIKKYRKSHKNATGQTITHYGKVNDYLPPSSHAYGIQTAGSAHVPQVLTDDKLQGVQGYMRDLKEEKYARNQNEPLGKTVTRNYNWPNQVASNDEFRFGVATKGSESAKDVMYNPVSLGTDDATQKLYIKSHGLYEAGEQKKRDYNWPFDPKNQVFGRTEKNATDEGRFCLQPETVNENFPKTQIVSKNVEDFRDFDREHLGKPKNLGQTNQYVNSDTVFGYKPRDNEPWDAAMCIKGQSTFNQVKEDESLGKSNRHGYKNVTKPGDETRVFGVPTIRNDIKKPGMRSVADPNNYGDEPASVGLLFPERFSELGIGQNDFQALRPKEELRKLFANIGYAYKPGKFEGVFMRAQQLSGSYNSYNDQASISAFIQAIKEMDHVQ